MRVLIVDDQASQRTMLRHLVEDISPEIKPRPGFGGITLAHNTRQKEDVARILAQAEAAGGKILKPAQDVFWGGHSGYFADPDGYQIEVIQRGGRFQ